MEMVIVETEMAPKGTVRMLDRIIQDIDSGWAGNEADEHFPWLAQARELRAVAVRECMGDLPCHGIED